MSRNIILPLDLAALRPSLKLYEDWLYEFEMNKKTNTAAVKKFRVFILIIVYDKLALKWTIKNTK